MKSETNGHGLTVGADRMGLLRPARSLEDEASAWKNASHDLAEWAAKVLMNRSDAYGRYARPEPGDRARVWTERSTLSQARLVEHFRGEGLLGLHTTSTANTSRFGVFDFDNHGTQDASTGSLADDNLRAASALVSHLQELGLHPILEDSDGQGGFHVWLIFSQPVPTPQLHSFLARAAAILRRSHSVGVEIFPAQPAISGPGLGNWVRLPGRHHTRPHWSRVRGPEGWLAGGDAVERFLAAEGDDPALLSDLRELPPDSDTFDRKEGVPTTNGEPLPHAVSRRTIETMEGMVPEGERNNRVFKAAAELSGNGLPADRVEDALLPGAIQSGLGKAEARRTIASATSKPRRPTLEVGAESHEYRPFPTEALPAPVRQYVRACADSIECDPGFIAPLTLSVLAAAIGSSAELKLSDTWTVPAIFWTVLVAPSGTRKTPAAKAATWPAVEVARERMRTLRQELEEYRQLPEEEGRNATEPIPRPATFVSDITPEALAALPGQFPGGLLHYCEEIGRLLEGFGRYNDGRGGSEVGMYLTLFDGVDTRIDRKTGDQRTIYLERPAVSICGTIQPTVLEKILTRQGFLENGLAARFRFAQPPPTLPSFREAPVPDEVRSGYYALYVKLLGQGDPHAPNVLQLIEQADELLRKFRRENYVKLEALADGPLRQAYAKLEATPARLALILHCVRRVLGEVSSDEIDAETMSDAIRLTEWFRNEDDRFYSWLLSSEADRTISRLVALVERKGGEISVRELQRSCFSTATRNATGAVDTLEGLRSQGRGHWLTEPTRKDGNRGGGDVFRLLPNPTPDKSAPSAFVPSEIGHRSASGP